MHCQHHNSLIHLHLKVYFENASDHYTSRKQRIGCVVVERPLLCVGGREIESQTGHTTDF